MCAMACAEEEERDKAEKAKKEKQKTKKAKQKVPLYCQLMYMLLSPPPLPPRPLSHMPASMRIDCSACSKVLGGFWHVCTSNSMLSFKCHMQIALQNLAVHALHLCVSVPATFGRAYTSWSAAPLFLPFHSWTQVPIASQVPFAVMLLSPCTHVRCLLQAKKKAQQDKAGGKRSQAAISTPAQPSKASQADSSESEEEEERERFSLLDSRFASLVDDSDGPLVGSQGAKAAPSLGQGSRLAPPLSSHDTAAESGNEEEGESVEQQGL